MFTITIAQDGTIYVQDAPAEVIEVLGALAPDDASLAERLLWFRTRNANLKS
jgi:hypothetical protein